MKIKYVGGARSAIVKKYPMYNWKHNEIKKLPSEIGTDLLKSPDFEEVKPVKAPSKIENTEEKEVKE